MPEHVDALVNLGNLLYLSGVETAAAARYLQALGLNPDHVEGNYNLANLLEGRGELASAAIFYQKAIQRGLASSPTPISTWPWSWRASGI